MKLHASLALLSLVPAATPLPAARPTKPAAIRVIVADVHETRSTSTQGPGLRLVLTLTGDAVADAHSVRRVRVTTARDDLDRDLVAPQPEVTVATPGPMPVGASSAEEQRRLEAVAAEVARRRAAREAAGAALAAPGAVVLMPPSGPTKTMLILRNASRQASVLKRVEGEVELFTPTEANGGIVRVADFTRQPGEVWANEALARAKVEAVYFTRAAFEDKGKLLGADALETFRSALRINGPESTFAAFRDPERRIVDVELVDRGGTRLPAQLMRGGSAEWDRTWFFKTPPPPDAHLSIRVATPDAIKGYPFTLENVPLP